MGYVLSSSLEIIYESNAYRIFAVDNAAAITSSASSTSTIVAPVVARARPIEVEGAIRSSPDSALPVCTYC